MTKESNDQIHEDVQLIDVSTSVVKVVPIVEEGGQTVFRIFLTDELGSEYEDVEAYSGKHAEFTNAVRLIQDRYRNDIPFVVPEFDTDATTLLKEMGGVNVTSTEDYVVLRSK